MNEIMDGHGRKYNDPKENLKKKPKKSILKSSSSFEVHDANPTGSKRKNGNPSQKETKWDEQNILETLHPPGKDYGHMKIEEPKTPYERLVQDEIDSPQGVDPKALSERLAAQAKSGRTRGSNPPPSEEEAERINKRKDFESRRKAHYNEFIAAKEALKNLKDEDDD